MGEDEPDEHPEIQGHVADEEPDEEKPPEGKDKPPRQRKGGMVKQFWR